MTYSNDVRLAVLERDVQQLETELRAINGRLDEILDTLSQMSGGKRALLGFFAIMGGMVTGVGAIVGIIYTLIRHQG